MFQDDPNTNPAAVRLHNSRIQRKGTHSQKPKSKQALTMIDSSIRQKVCYVTQIKTGPKKAEVGSMIDPRICTLHTISKSLQ